MGRIASRTVLALALLAGCLLPLAHAQCSVLLGTEKISIPQLSNASSSPCVSLTNGADSVNLAANYELSSNNRSISSIDLSFGVFSVVSAGFQLSLSNVVLLSSVLFTPLSQMAAINGPVPAAFDMRQGGSVQLRNVTLFASCISVSQWSSFISNSTNSSTTYLIASFSTNQTSLVNVTLTCNRSLVSAQLIGCPSSCNGNSSSLPSTIVHSGPELTTKLPLLTSLASSFSVSSHSNIDLSGSPAWLIDQGSNATINGGGGWMNLGGNPTLATLGTSPRTSLSLINLILFNGCVQFDLSNPSLQPSQQVAISSTLPGIVYSGASKFSTPPFQGVSIKNSTIIVSSDEVQALTYLYIALKSPTLFTTPSITPLGQQFQVQSISLQSPPTPSSLSISSMTGPGLSYSNVIVTSLPPQGLTVSPTQFLCNAPNRSHPVDPSSKPPTSLYSVTSTNSFTQVMSGLSLSPSGSSPSSPLPSPYPPILVISDTVNLPLNPSPPFTLTRNTLFTSPSLGPIRNDAGAGGAPLGSATLDLNNGLSIITVASGARLFLQRLRLINPVITQLPSTDSFTVQRSALPLYAFKGDRSSSFLQTSMCTLVLSTEDFVQVYTIASKGSVWKADSSTVTNLLVQGTEVFNTKAYNCSFVTLYAYQGWGLSATDLRIEPDNPSRSCSLILPPATLSPPPTPPLSTGGSSNSSSSNAQQVGVGVGVGVGLLLIGIIGSFVFGRWRRARVALHRATDVSRHSKASGDLREMEDAPGELIPGGRRYDIPVVAGGSQSSHGRPASSHANPYGAPSSAAGGGNVNHGVDLWKQLYDASAMGMNEEGGFEGGREGEDAANAFIAVAQKASLNSPDQTPDPSVKGGNLYKAQSAMAALTAADRPLGGSSLNHQRSGTSANDGLQSRLSADPSNVGRRGTGASLSDSATHEVAAEASKSSQAPKASSRVFDPHREVATIAKELSNEANKLQLLEPIGQGGFGTVYRGRWRNLEVAVKTVLFSEQTNSETGTNTKKKSAHPQQRAVLEAAVCTSVMHQNVVTTYHYDITPVSNPSQGMSGMTIEMGTNTDWKLYLVQEYCNASLHDALRNRLLHKAETKTPDLDLILSVLMDIARGMIYIHSKNIIHGDLTPGNVLLKQEASSPIGVVGKITDFGLCTTIDPGATHISNVTNGTPYYVAPEVVANGMLEKNSDVYSFGVLMWELYRCMPPWVKTDTGYTLNKRFRRFPVSTPRIYVALCARCLDSKPKSRPPFPQVLAELEAMHAAYLLGYDSLEEPLPPPQPSEEGSGGSGARGSGSKGSASGSKSAQGSSEKEVPLDAEAVFARISDVETDSIRLPAPMPTPEPAQVGIDEEEVIADKSGIVSTTHAADQPFSRSQVSMNPALMSGGGGGEGGQSRGLHPPPRSQALVQYLTSKEIRRKGKDRDS